MWLLFCRSQTDENNVIKKTLLNMILGIKKFFKNYCFIISTPLNTIKNSILIYINTRIKKTTKTLLFCILNKLHQLHLMQL